MLQLYESNEKPYVYACICQYSKFGKTDTMTLEIAPPGSTWDFAWDMFRKIFEKKCGRRWKETIDGVEREIDPDDDQEMFFECVLPESFSLNQVRCKVRNPEEDEQKNAKIEDKASSEQVDDQIFETFEEEADIDDTHLP